MKIETPSPLYDTKYCIRIVSPFAESIKVNYKKDSNHIARATLDKEGSAELKGLSQA